MKTIIFKIWVFLLLSSLCFPIYAYDIELDGIYYNLNTSDKTATVTWGGEKKNSGTPSYKDSLTIPSYINYGNQEIPVVGIDEWAFCSCKDLVAITLPNTIETIGSTAFGWCTSLEKIEIPNLVKTISSGLLEGCLNISEVILPIGVTSIEDSSFDGCEKLQQINIPNSVIRIGTSAFAKSGLIKVIIPNSVTEIGGAAFYYCRDLESISISNNTIKIGDNAFSGCENLNSVFISNLIAWCSIDFSNSDSNPLTYGNHLFLNEKELTDLIIPEQIREIKNYSFINCTSLQSIKINKNINRIGSSAFNGCENISKVELENGDSYLSFSSGNSFGSSVEEVFLGRDITGSTPFSSIPKLKNLILGPFVTNASCLIFESYENLSKITCYNDKPPVISEPTNSQYASVLIEIPTGSLIDYSSAQYWKNFWNYIENPNLISYFEVDNIRYLINSASEVTLYSVNFTDPINLVVSNNIDYDNSSYKISAIAKEAFKDCKNLLSISIPSSVSIIGNDAFSKCSSLKKVIFETSTQSIQLGYKSSIYIDSSIIPFPNATTVSEERTGFRNGYIDGLFYDLPIEELIINRNIELPLYYERRWGGSSGSYETIYDDIVYYPPFYGLKKLKNVEIGENVTSICKNTIDVVMKAIPTIMNYTNFGQCNSIQTVTSKNPTAPIGGGFSQTAYDNATLYLPNGGKASYMSDEFWKYFKNIIEGNYIPVESITIEQESVELPIEGTLQLKLIVNPENATYPSVSWKSSNEKIVTVSELGVLTGIAEGSANVTVTIGELQTTCEVSVYNPIVEVESIILNIEESQLYINETLQLEATVLPENTIDKTVIWQSSNNVIATVNESGLVTAISEGTATITATKGNISTTCQITVLTPIIEAEQIILNLGSAKLNIGETVQLEATVLPEDTTDQTIIWNTSDENVATISYDGLVTAISEGTAIITATCGAASAECVITVINSIIETEQIILNIESAELNIGETVQLEATVLPEDTTDKSLSWNSSDPNIATVSDEGLITALSAGTAIITATSGDTYAECVITVLEDAGVESLLANPESKISIYSTEGILIKKDCKVEDLKTLHKGIYIIVSGKDRYKISI